MNLIFGYNAIINEDEYHAYMMLESEQLKEEIGQPKVVDAIYELMINGSDCDEDKMTILLESI